ncbi:MAG: glycosyltransferase family 2 protein [Thermoplasmata archaeon]
METPEAQPKASIVILTKNGSETIRRCLGSLFNQETGFEFEVIAIDSGSTDGTLNILAEYPVKIEKIPPSDFNFGATKNLGFSVSEGEFVVFLSQDAIPVGNDWLQRMTTPLEDPEVMIVQGLEMSGKQGFYWWREGLFWNTSEIRRWMERYDNIGLSCVTLAVRRKAWEKVKFDTVPFGEDKLFQKKAVEAGLRIVLAKDAFVEHTHNFTCRSLRNRLTNEGLGARVSGESYSLRDMFGDILKKQPYRNLVRGLRNGKIKNMAEFFYPLARPFYIYKGMRFAREFQRD